ncbi:hypothetical protein ACFYVR_20685 [Rhodococcus sp. NPDC003318]|uniref:hypothetical protein n=1 Tax=Rhodococcus sp. NPDC003318 TaxID=3364503 RepID=UPI003680CCDE
MAESLAGWTELAQAVDSGQLWLAQGVAQQCARHCSDLSRKLVEIQHRARSLSQVDGFGTFPSGIALAKKFSDKASGGVYSMDRALADHIAEVERMREVFVKIDAMYRDADDSGAQLITGAGSGS